MAAETPRLMAPMEETARVYGTPQMLRGTDAPATLCQLSPGTLLPGQRRSDVGRRMKASGVKSPAVMALRQMNAVEMPPRRLPSRVKCSCLWRLPAADVCAAPMKNVRARQRSPAIGEWFGLESDPLTTGNGRPAGGTMPAEPTNPPSIFFAFSGDPCPRLAPVRSEESLLVSMAGSCSEGGNKTSACRSAAPRRPCPLPLAPALSRTCRGSLGNLEGSDENADTRRTGVSCCRVPATASLAGRRDWLPAAADTVLGPGSRTVNSGVLLSFFFNSRAKPSTARLNSSFR